MFAFLPIGLNAVIVVATGWLFHRFTGHAYPHRASPVPTAPPPITEADISVALETFGEPLDVSAADLLKIANLAAAEARKRA